MKKIGIRPMHYDDIPKVYELCKEVFSTHIDRNPDSPGRTEFLNATVAPGLIRKRMMDDSDFTVAVEGNTIVGMSELRPPSHLMLLFVAEKQHGKGVGKLLLEQVINSCYNIFPDKEILTVNATPNALLFYQKQGFIATDKEQLLKGLRFVPMELSLQPKLI